MLETVFWGFLIGGALFTIVSVLIGDVLGSWLDGVFDLAGIDWLNPVVLAGAATTFGGAGILLSKYTNLGSTAVLVAALLIAFLVAVVVFLAFVKPMMNSEVSTGFSMKELGGKIGEITIPVPAKGFGEVMVKLGAANTIHTASSFEHKPLAAGTRVVVIEVTDGVLVVSDLNV